MTINLFSIKTFFFSLGIIIFRGEQIFQSNHHIISGKLYEQANVILNKNKNVHNKQRMIKRIKIRGVIIRDKMSSMFVVSSFMVYVNNMDLVCFMGVQLWWGVFLEFDRGKIENTSYIQLYSHGTDWSNSYFLPGIIITGSGPIFHPIIHYLR